MLQEGSHLDPALIAPLLGAAERLNIEGRHVHQGNSAAVWGIFERQQVGLGLRMDAGHLIGYNHFVQSTAELPFQLFIKPRITTSANSGTGDLVFDRRVVVEGPEELRLAVLECDCREQIFNALGDHGEVQITLANNRAVLDDSHLHRLAPEIVLQMQALFSLLRAARRAALRQLDQLLSRATEDPEPEVRGRAALFAFRRALDAASERRAEVLSELAKNPSVPLNRRRRALDALARSPAHLAMPTMVALLDCERSELLEIALDFLSEGAPPETLPRLLALLERVPSHRQIAAIARALGGMRIPEAEAPLLDLLDHRSRRIQIAAIHGLAQCGSRQALEKLSKVKQRLFLGQALRAAVIDAVATLNARVTLDLSPEEFHPSMITGERDLE